jgi:hypothetical protein
LPRRRPRQGVAADGVEHQVGLPRDVLEALRGDVDEPVGTELGDQPGRTGTAGAQNAGARVARQLDGQRTHAAGRAMDEHGLPLGEAAVLEQSLPGGQSGHRQRGAHRVVDTVGQ